LGPYEILGQIGAGGMGEVYRARDERLKRDVAIKVLPASFSQDADRLRRFEHEAQAAGSLNHPNITVVYDFGGRDGAPYVVQELLEGETLRVELAAGRFSPRKAIDYALQIAHGLAAAHDKGIVHRDLKPENVFVTRDGRLKILDFGLAKLTQTEAGSGPQTDLPTATAGTEPGVVMGTLGYMSPEQIKGKPADARSDIFALGVILFEMLSGERPFRGDSAGEIMASIVRDDPPDLSVTNRSISPGLERIVRHCLEKNPERRFQSARDLAFDLEAISGLSGSAAPAVMRPRIWLWALAAAALLAVGALAVWSVTRVRRETPVSYSRITFRRGTVYSARFAPDGQTIVYSAAWEGQPARIFAARVGSRESRQLPLPDARILAVSSTGELAIQIGRDTIWESIGTLARVPLEGGAPREVLENVTRADWSPDGRELAVVHLVEGKYRVEFPIGKVLYETTDYVYSIRFSPRGDRLAIGQMNAGPFCLDLTGNATTLTEGWSFADVAWRPDGGEIWFVGERPAGKLALYGVTLSGRERTLRLEAAGLYLHDVSRDGRALLNNYLWDSNLAALPAGENNERELSWMDRSFVNNISSDGRFVVFTEWGEGGGAELSIYLRPLDGSAAVRLGDGWGLALSPDNRWVLSSPRAEESFVLLPTGPGQPKRLEHRGLSAVGSNPARFLPDGTGFLFLGRSGNGPIRAYVQSVEGGEPRALSAEGLSEGSVAVSPDGRLFAARGADSKIAIYPMDSGAPRPLSGAEAGEMPILWSSDGGSIYVHRGREAPALVFKIDVATGRRDLWKTIAPADRSGLVAINGIVMTPDARTYAYGYERILTSLQVVDGLR
jgi:Tol biopolymer transport system component